MSKRPRADAERNRRRVLVVAQRLFVERGDGVHMSEVAAEAGVGIGTLYRHFPTRQALIEAIAGRRFAEILDFARDRCLPEPDAHLALTRFLTHVAEIHEQGRGLTGAIEATLGSTAPRGKAEAELLAVGAALVRHGQDTGTLAPGITVRDLYMIVGAVAILSRNAIGDWRRFIEIALAGMRPG
ncbi:TetR/AcrR family transcriptional regulator [Streptosporangium sp. KLBMP 9127]|nr:TetR/AcrR family transcriptional regulator [Streptosporangium sp. KLBMP 9127]